jgi:O-antigen/teichoic acid export membrane protein
VSSLDRPAADNKRLRAQAARAVFWSSVQTWGGQAVSLATFLVLARLLEPVDFGLVALAGVVIMFAQTFADQGFAQAIIQRRELDRSHLDAAFWSSLVFAFALGGIVVALAGPIASAFDAPALKNVLSVLAIVFPLIGLTSVQEALLQRDLRFNALAARSLFATFVGGVVGITLALSGFGVWSLVAQLIAGRAAGVVVLWSASSWRPRMSFSPRHYRDVFSFGIHVSGANALNFFNRHADDLLIGYFLGATALGYYTVAYRVLRVMTNLLSVTVSQVALPTFSRLQHDARRVVRAFYTATEMTSLVAFPAFISMAVLAPQIVQFLFGPRWATSIPVMQILCGVGIVHSVFMFNSVVLTALGKPSWVLGLTAISVVANLIAFAISVQYGIVWVAAAYVTRAYLLAPLPILAVRRVAGISVRRYLRQFVPALLGSAAMAAVELGVRQALGAWPGLTVVVAMSAGLLVYLTTVRVIAPSTSASALSLLRAAIPRRSTRAGVAEASSSSVPLT